ncbi:prepilin peptidase [Candidatus Woesearchaeota archaeon]|nr:prepilin peptidase [Candidatus Woesearchaeota archaeon]
MDTSLLILYLIALIALLIASYTDLKTREVPDWLNYSLIFAGLGLRLVFSLYYENWWHFLEGIAGLILLVAVGLLMFYTGQWGGGDSKMLMALGAVFGMPFTGWDLQVLMSTPLVSFFVNLLLLGAVYGLMYSLYLALRQRKSFMPALKKGIAGVKGFHVTVVSLLVLCIIAYFMLHDTYIRFITIALLVMMLFTLIIWVFVRTVEKVCMLSLVHPKVLTEGDWVAKEVKYKGKAVAGPKDLGVSKEQIRLLVKLYKQKKIKKVWLKTGIPFVPSFLAAFIATVLAGNLLQYIGNQVIS